MANPVLWDDFINHEIRIPSFNNQDSTHDSSPRFRVCWGAAWAPTLEGLPLPGSVVGFWRCCFFGRLWRRQIDQFMGKKKNYEGWIFFGGISPSWKTMARVARVTGELRVEVATICPEKSGVERSSHHHISVLWIPGQDFTSQPTNIQSLPGRFVEKSVDVETFQSAAGPPTSSDVTMKKKILGDGCYRQYTSTFQIITLRDGILNDTEKTEPFCWAPCWNVQPGITSLHYLAVCFNWGIFQLMIGRKKSDKILRCDDKRKGLDLDRIWSDFSVISQEVTPQPGLCWKNVGLTFSHFCTCALKNACTEKALEVMQW